MKRIIALAASGIIAILAVTLTPAMTPPDDGRWDIQTPHKAAQTTPAQSMPPYPSTAPNAAPAASPGPTPLILAPVTVGTFSFPAGTPQSVVDAAIAQWAAQTGHTSPTPPPCYTGYVPAGSVGSPCD